PNLVRARARLAEFGDIRKNLAVRQLSGAVIHVKNADMRRVLRAVGEAGVDYVELTSTDQGGLKWRSGIAPHTARYHRLKFDAVGQRLVNTLGDRGGVLIGSISRLLSFKQGDVITQREIPMTKRFLMLATVTFALVCGGMPARAQEDTDDPAMMRHWQE